MAHPDLSFRAELEEEADKIDLSPRQWYLLASEIKLGAVFAAEGAYDLSWRDEESVEYLRLRAANRLIRNGANFVRAVNRTEVVLQKSWRGTVSPGVQRLPDDASVGLRKAQVAVSWLRTKVEVENEWVLVSPLLGLILPEETSAPEDQEFDGFGDFEEIEGASTPLAETLAATGLTDHQWELVGARFGPSAQTDTVEIAAAFDVSPTQLKDLLAATQDQLVECLPTLIAPLKSLNRNIAIVWPEVDFVSAMQSGDRLVHALEIDGIEAEREDADKLFNAYRAIDRLDGTILVDYPNVKSRLSKIQSPTRPVASRTPKSR